MEENVLSRLRKLVSVEGDVKRLQNLMNKERGDEEQPESAASLLYVREQQKEIQQLTMKARGELVALREGSQLERLLPLLKSFLQHQKATLSTVEGHLQQYGYKPPTHLTQTVESGQGDGVVEEESDGRQQDDTRCSPAFHPRPVDLDRTPTLEDYGLSQAKINAILRKDYTTAYGIPDPGSTAPSWSASSRSLPDSSVRSNTALGVRDPHVPDCFQQPVMFTPGLFNGRPVATVTPSQHQGAPRGFLPAPDSSVRPATPKQNIFSRISSCADPLDSPVPPVFTTPGLKSLPRYSQHIAVRPPCPAGTDSPVPPLMTTPGVEQLHRPAPQPPPPPPGPAGNTGLNNQHCPGPGGYTTDQHWLEVNSPTPPTMMTPGVKQLYRPPKMDDLMMEDEDGGPATSEDNSPAFPHFTTPGLNRKMKGLKMAEGEGESSQDNTPNPPELTTPHRNNPHHTANYTTNGARPSCLEDTPKTPELSNFGRAVLSRPPLRDIQLDPPPPCQAPPPHCQATPPHSPTPPQRPVAASMWAAGDDEMPETPELTYCFKKVDLTSGVAPDSSPNNTVQLLHSHKPEVSSKVKLTNKNITTPSDSENTNDDDDMPLQPKLTYSFRNKTATSPEKGEPGAANDGRVPRPEPPVPSGGGSSRESQEDSAPFIPRITPLVEAEYNAQPKYIRSQLSHDVINQAVDEINVLLTAKARGGGAMFLLEEDLTVLDLDRKTNTFCLALINAKRIATGFLNTDRVYSVISQR